MLRGIEETVAFLASADVMEACFTRHVAVARTPAPWRISAGVAEFLGAGMRLIATEHRAEAVEQQRTANHAGGGRRRGAQKGAAAAAIILRHRLLILLVLLR